VPTALCGVVRVAFSAYENKNYLEILPLLVIELNTVFMWTCVGYVEVGLYVNNGSDKDFIKGSEFRQGAIIELLGAAINLEALNIFLYIWRFLGTLERNALNACVKRSYYWFAVLTGVAVPLIYYGLFTTLVISFGYYSKYRYAPIGHRDQAELEHWGHVCDIIVSTFGYLTACTNCLACMVMALVVLLVHKITRATATGHTTVQTRGIKGQERMNTLVTGVHIVLILVYTVISILKYNVPRFDGVDGDSVAYYRVLTAWLMFGGISDLLLTCLMFLILDEELKVDFLYDEKRNVNYAVLEVIDKIATHDSV
jgi:hypothetical protein